MIDSVLKLVDFKTLSKNPSEIEDMIAHLKKENVVFIDEIQKIPDLLDEVHRLIEDKKIKFILTGSSARKLRQHRVNLLAGRAIMRRMYPISLKEMAGKIKIADLLFRGQLPLSLNADADSDVNDFLFTYVDTYLKEEIFH